MDGDSPQGAVGWRERLAGDGIVVIDGATGTELQRRGVPMDEIAWSGAAVLSHPDLVRAVHEDYIRCGAAVVISNTFGSTRQMLGPAGYAEHVETVNRRGVELAREACDRVAQTPVAVAGSMSAMPPGFDRDAYFPPQRELDSYREAVGILAGAGADLIALEMMEDTEHAARAMRAAVESGLPVWLGVSCKRSQSGELTGFGHSQVRLTEVLDALLPMGPAVVNIMHTNPHLIADALTEVRGRWTGPLGVYPDSGYFTRPNWNFVDVIPPADLVAESAGWVRAGARLLGGCCGTGPEHVRALCEAVPELALQR
ncbi:MAG: homocysteine methyltransferase [Planctomycetaceae bacterium]|nr:homocysteine methyltransferase [Planctomycetaceae bacterium]